MAWSMKNAMRSFFGLPPDGTYMVPLDLSKDAEKYLDENQKFFVKKLNKKNALRYVQAKKMSKRSRFFGLLLLGFGLSLYGGTIYNIKQEKFLDELDVPPNS